MIRSLKIFCDLVESQNFTQTAHKNYITQSAVSHHIQTLERRYGHQLLERTRKSLRLTWAGKMIYDAGMELVSRFERLEQALQKKTEKVSGPLRIAATLAAGLYQLPLLITAYLKKYPEVDFKIIYQTAPEIYQAVLSSEVSLGITGYPKSHPRLNIIPLQKDTLCVIVSDAHAWKDRLAISLGQLNGEKLVLLRSGFPTRVAIDKILKKAGTPTKVVHEFDDVEMIKRAVETGLGISIVPWQTARQEALSKMLQRLKITEGPFESTSGVLVKKNSELPIPAQKFVELLPKITAASRSA